MEISLDNPNAPAAPRRVVIRPLCGHDELCECSDPYARGGIVDRLLVDAPGTVAGAGESARLTLADHDRVIAAIYEAAFGDVVVCHLECAGCRTGFSLSFSLDELRATRVQPPPSEHSQPIAVPDDNGTFRIGEDLRFRLPTRGDLAEVRDLSPHDAPRALAQRCWLGGEAGPMEALEDAIEAIDPRLDTDIDAGCPACSRAHSVPFSIERYVLAAFERERSLVIREVHLLARAYGWSRREILDLSRTDRHLHVRLCLADAEHRGANA